jgi:hypothetical protein
MNAWLALGAPLLLSAASITGIVSLLLFDGAADIAALVLTALPLIVGVVVLVRHERRAKR